MRHLKIITAVAAALLATPALADGTIGCTGTGIPTAESCLPKSMLPTDEEIAFTAMVYAVRPHADLCPLDNATMRRIAEIQGNRPASITQWEEWSYARDNILRRVRGGPDPVGAIKTLCDELHGQESR